MKPYPCPWCINRMNDRTLGAMGTLRVLVSGWRYWPRKEAGRIHTSLERIRETTDQDIVMVVIDGMCPRGGADDYAHEWARSQHPSRLVMYERHPAIYTGGKLHGPERNTHMVELGLDILLSFPESWTRRTGGTWDCTRKAMATNCIWHVEAYAHEPLKT